ncbi:hypothetical protein [Vampirovibrio sp.]|uniref:hypothetical protein n=1 Tax=Vampirovibrio sp. TaxID=2717857 RepID=UPI0035948593
MGFIYSILSLGLGNSVQVIEGRIGGPADACGVFTHHHSGGTYANRLLWLTTALPVGQSGGLQGALQTGFLQQAFKFASFAAFFIQQGISGSVYPHFYRF